METDTRKGLKTGLVASFLVSLLLTMFGFNTGPMSTVFPILTNVVSLLIVVIFFRRFIDINKFAIGWAIGLVLFMIFLKILAMQLVGGSFFDL